MPDFPQEIADLHKERMNPIRFLHRFQADKWSSEARAKEKKKVERVLRGLDLQIVEAVDVRTHKFVDHIRSSKRKADPSWGAPAAAPAPARQKST